MLGKLPPVSEIETCGIVVIKYVLLFIAGYCVGSFPTAIAAGKWLRNIDIRQYGSGNAGGTNAGRVLGRKVGLAVGVTDGVKGVLCASYLPHLLGSILGVETPEVVCLGVGIAAVIGHVFPIWANFAGGKGVATASGVYLALTPLPFLLVLACFGIILKVGRMVSVASVLSFALWPLILWICQRLFPNAIPGPPFILLTVGLAVFINWTHRENWWRILHGREPKLGPREHQTG